MTPWWPIARGLGMPQSPSPHDSRRDLRAEVTFNIGGSAPEVLPASRYLVGIHLELPSVGAFSGSLELFDQEGDYINALVLNVGFLPTISIRFWEDGYSSPYFHAGITSLEPEFLPEGVRIKIGLCHKAAHTASLQVVQRGWPANTNPSDIIRTIAKDRGWAVVDEDGKPTIEQCAFPLDHPVQTTDGSDMAFIRERVLPNSMDANKQHFEFRLIGDARAIVVFRSTASRSMQKVRKSYTYLRDPNGEVIRFAPSDNSLGAWLMGAGASRHESVSSADGALTTEQATPTNGLGATAPIQDASYTTPVPGGTTTRRFPSPGRSVTDTRTAAAVLWSRAAGCTILADLEVIGTHDLLPGEFVNVNYFLKDGTPHVYSGEYRILLVTHEFSMSGWVTTAHLARGGQQATKGLSKMKATVVITPVDAGAASSASSSPVRKGGDTPRSKS